MKKLFLLLLVLPMLAAQSQTRSQKKTETFWEKVMRIAGVSATPASLRGDEQIENGDIWLVTVAEKPVAQRLTRGGHYVSPVFDGDGQSVLALNAEALYRVPLNGGPPTSLGPVRGVSKLVGVNRDNPDQMLVLARSQGAVYAAMLSIRSHALARLPHNPQSAEDKVMLAHLAGWERVYGDTILYTEKNEKEGVQGTMQFSDVYLKRGGDKPVNLSNGNGISSGQPSLSPDGNQVVFIRGR